MANEKIVNRENLKAFREKYDEKLTSGQLVVSKSLVAKELETVSPESGDTQETPFALQGTGTANGTSSVDTGTVGKHIQKQGSVYCVNQLMQNGNFESTNNLSSSIGTISVSNNELSVVNTNEISSNTSVFVYAGNQSALFVKDHKYLIVYQVYSPVSGYAKFDGNFSNRNTVSITANTWSNFYSISVASSSGTSNIYVQIQPNTTISSSSTIKYRNLQIIDLTQWFNGNIPQDLLDHPEHWSWYQTYGDYITYNTGTLVSGNGVKLVSTGRNLWDEEWAANGINITTGLDNNNRTNRIRTSFVIVIPNTTYYFYNGSVTTNLTDIGWVYYYDKNKTYISRQNITKGQQETRTTPQNCYYIRLEAQEGYGTTYKNDITISLYYAGEDYSQYYPYEQPKVYDTGDEELLSTGVKLSVSGEREDIYDYKEPNGTITRRVGVVDLSQCSWTYNDTYGVFFTQISDKKNGLTNLICSKYPIDSTSANWTVMQDKCCRGYADGTYFYIKDSSLSGNSSNITGTLYYELATPTTEQGTPFSENIEINNFGTMGWYATYTDANTNALASVPQGCKIFYPAWYVGFVDTLGQRADIDWNANNVVSQTELGAIDTKHDSLCAIMQENIGGTLRHQLSGVDFLNTAWIDLGSLTYTYDSTNQRFYAICPTNMKQSSTRTTKMVCPLYKTISDGSSFDSSWNMVVYNQVTNLIYIHNHTYTDADTFKNAMKGILLAYEKAS